MNLARKMARAVSLLEDRRALPALLSWPMFSLTSFLMVSRLARQGIVPHTVIDAGANVGQFAVAASKLFPHVMVHSFEPNPASVARLRKNVSGLNNVRVHPMALGERSGQTEFYMNRYSHSSSVLHLTAAHQTVFPQARETAAVTVAMTTLDDALADVELTSPVLLKMDVEGYEAQTIAGARQTLPRVDYAVIETCFAPLHEGQPTLIELTWLMAAHDFGFARPVDCVANPRNGEIIMMDALFIRQADAPKR